MVPGASDVPVVRPSFVVARVAISRNTGARSNTALLLYKKQVGYSFTEFLQVVAFCQQHPRMTSMTSVQFFPPKT